jgi:phosphoserine aminotransferase
MNRPFNFSAGPATIPLEVLNRAGAEIADWHGTGMGVMEMSHRGVSFGEILNGTLARRRIGRKRYRADELVWR